MKKFDLEPHEYRAEPLKGEPFFGPGVWPFIAQFGTMFAVMALIRYFVT